jgi:vacuolar-type H+-ATPase subunit H
MPVTIETPTAGEDSYLGPDWDPDTAEPDDQPPVRRSLRWGPVYRTVEVDERLGELTAEVAWLTEANTKLAGDSGTLDEREQALTAQLMDMERRRSDVMAQGQAAADGMVSRARAAAEQTVTDAKRRATVIEADAQRRAADVVRAARALADEIVEEAKAEAVDINPVPTGDIVEQAQWALDHSSRVLAKAQEGADAHGAAVEMLSGTSRAVAALREAPDVELLGLGRAPELTTKAGTASGS